ncbi:acyl carrier protein [Streptomyces sp. CA-111067]|uniref:acyl carrier protein n=1 Tax=Streptomyces sp. CA-111067 TaxID=3240046 RepID=UPI003D98C875
MSFTIDELMEILVVKAGLPRSAVTADPTATLTDVDLDSLAQLQVRAEIADRYGVELDDEHAGATFGELVALVNHGTLVSQGTLVDEGLSEHAR